MFVHKLHVTKILKTFLAFFTEFSCGEGKTCCVFRLAGCCDTHFIRDVIALKANTRNVLKSRSVYHDPPLLTTTR